MQKERFLFFLKRGVVKKKVKMGFAEHEWGRGDKILRGRRLERVNPSDLLPVWKIRPTLSRSLVRALLCVWEAWAFVWERKRDRENKNRVGLLPSCVTPLRVSLCLWFQHSDSVQCVLKRLPPLPLSHTSVQPCMWQKRACACLVKYSNMSACCFVCPQLSDSDRDRTREVEYRERDNTKEWKAVREGVERKGGGSRRDEVDGRGKRNRDAQ